MIRAAGGSKDNYCTACFDGNYPVEIPENIVRLGR